jgi:ABC-type multidrug transport system fused ATPase/permease subunit
VGRTGAGKSSLVATLMRLAESWGEILMDGLNVKEFNMLSTRKCVSVISQSPTLINGTIQSNVAAEIWNACITYTKQKLFSCTVKIVSIQYNKILILDEETGKIDGNTDKEIQRIIDEIFKGCTIITIGHRLSSILHCNRVMVFDQGEIKEFDRPDLFLMKK